MDTTVAAFVAAHYHREPGSKITLRDAYRSFLSSLSERDRTLWPRWRFIREISTEFMLGRDSSNRLCIAGLSRNPPKQWVVVDGRLTKVPS